MQGCEVSTRLRYRLTLASGMLECLCFAGVVFGFASLMFVLKEDGYFSYLCATVPGTNGTLTITGKQLWSSGLRGDLVVVMPIPVFLLSKPNMDLSCFFKNMSDLGALFTDCNGNLIFLLITSKVLVYPLYLIANKLWLMFITSSLCV